MHIGFILDGNGRWAASKSLPRSVGHKRGAENVESIIRECKDDWKTEPYRYSNTQIR